MEKIEEWLSGLEEDHKALLAPENRNKPLGQLVGELGWFSDEFTYCFNENCVHKLSDLDPIGKLFLSSFKSGDFKITDYEWIPNSNPMASEMAGTLYYEWTWHFDLKKEKEGTVFMNSKAILNLGKDMKITQMFVYNVPQVAALVNQAFGFPKVH